MQKLFSATISCVLLASAAPAVADDNPSIFVSPCAEWHSGVPVNTEALDKLKKSSATERPSSGQSQTKNQFVVLLGKNLVGARDTLANYKDKLPKTSEGMIDLRDVTLNGFNLSGLNLDNVDFKGAEMNGVDLSGSSLRGASLYKAELEGANLNNTNLSFANAAKAKLGNASLCQATLTSTELEDATLKGAYLKGAKLDMARNIPKSIYLNVESVLHFGLPVPPDN
jgi:hypothetical protein